MESENRQGEESKGNPGPSATTSDSAKQANACITEGLYVLRNKKTRTLLDLSGGNTASGTPCQGWQRNTGDDIDNQLWALRKAGTNGLYRLMSLRGSTYLDLEAGKSEDGSRVCGYKHVDKGDAKGHQEWRISQERDSYYLIQNSKSGTYLEIQGNLENGGKVACSKRSNNAEHQLWDLERASRTTLEIREILKSWSPKTASCVFQPHENSNEYFVLPSVLRNKIWNETKLLRQAIRKSTFDYDSFVIKCKDAINTWAKDRLRADGYTTLFGIVFGAAKRGPKAYNWYLSSDLKALVFFDAQTGTEYTAAGLEDFEFEPAFVLL